MIVVIDYGVGNLGSVVKALNFLGIPVKLSKKREEIFNSDGIILPGVGAFGTGMKNLKKAGLANLINEVVQQGKPLLGICLGLQLLFDKSEEAPDERGLGLISGEVKKFSLQKVKKIPHVGWNTLKLKNDNNLLKEINPPYYFYFVHSFYVVPQRNSVIKGKTDYEIEKFTSLVRKENIWGIQCHPEKSSDTGLVFLKEFADYCKID